MDCNSDWKLLFPQHKFNAITNEIDLIIFVVDWITTIILLGSLFYIMVDNNNLFMYPWYTLYAIAMCEVAISYYVKVHIHR